MKFLRIVFLYALLFVAAVIVFGLVQKSPGAEKFVLGVFLVPALLVWWNERRVGRAAKRLQDLAHAKTRETPQVRAAPMPPSHPAFPQAGLSSVPNLPESPSPKRTNWQDLDLSRVVQTNREQLALAESRAEDSPLPNLARSIPAATDSTRAARSVASADSQEVRPAIKLADDLRAPADMTTELSTGTVNRPTVSLGATAKVKDGWVPRGQSVVIHGRQINGMIYFGPAPYGNRNGFSEKLRAYIDPSLPVARLGLDRDGTGMPYWPSYSSIPPECRATYLDWLAAGASDGSVNPGYMFLYFYGLERRFFVDRPSQEEQIEIVEEVRRLAGVFAGNHSARVYLGTFIDLAEIAARGASSLKPIYDSPTWDVPFPVKVAIGARLQNGANIEADWLLSWFLCHPEKNLRTAGRRCADEFQALFRIRFAERFPEGLRATKPRKTLKATYQAASREFEGTITPQVDGKPVLDVAGLRKPIEIAQEIADASMEELEKFSRYIGRNPEGRGSVEAHALLPHPLRALYPSKELLAIQSWAQDIVTSGGMVLVSDVLERLEGEPPSQLGKRQLTGAADALARLGIGLAPDPRFALRSPTLAEPVVLFDLGGPIELLEDVSAAYQDALMELALASFVAHADGTVSPAEVGRLESQVRSTVGLSDVERRRLLANLAWFVAVPPDLTLLRRKLKDVASDRHAGIRSALSAAANADGLVSADEVSGIEKIYRALGLDENLVYADLHAGDVPDGPLRVRAAHPGAPGEAIPAEAKAQPPKLDASRIASIRRDTDRVSAVLSDIFSADLEDRVPQGKPEKTGLPGLDAKHSALLRDLLAQKHWTEEEFAGLTARHGLLVSGALETINEWSYGAYDDAVLEEYDGYDVSSDIADALADAFEMEK